MGGRVAERAGTAFEMRPSAPFRTGSERPRCRLARAGVPAVVAHIRQAGTKFCTRKRFHPLAVRLSTAKRKPGAPSSGGQ